MTVPPSSASRFPLGALALLALAIFASVTAELVPAGLLVPIAADLGTTESAAGLLVSGFAVAVAVTAIPLTAATRRMPRKVLLVVLLGVLAITTTASGLAPDYPSMMAARLVGGAANGLFWAVVGPYATRLVTPDRLARAITITTLGGTLAFIGGVPLGTAVSAILGWRLPFLVLAGILLVCGALIAVALPKTPDREPNADRVVAPRATLARRLALVEALVLLVVVAQNLSYVYLSVWVTDRQVEATATALLAFGIAGGIGAALAGTVADRWPWGSLVVGTALTIAALILLAIGIPELRLPGVALWGFAFGPLPVLLQALVFRVVPDRMRDLAAAVHTVVFNLAIAAGAAVGGGVIAVADAGILPLVSVAVFSVALGGVVGAALVGVVSQRRENAIIDSSAVPQR